MRLIGLDVGTRRIGVAKADTSTKIAVPDGFINVNGQEFSEIARLSRLYNTKTFVIGLPRNNQGEETAQSTYVRRFAQTLAQTIPGTKIYFQDESLTSVEAESRLKTRKDGFEKGDVDAESAAIILQDCIEHFTNRANSLKPPKTDIGEIWDGAKEAAREAAKTTSKKAKSTAKKAGSTGSKAGKIIAAVVIVLVILIGAGFFFANNWYQDQLHAVAAGVSCNDNDDPTTQPESCQSVKFTVAPSQSVSDIAKNLENQKLIRSSMAFRFYVHFNGNPALQAGDYLLRESMSTPEIVDTLAKGNTDNVFSFTILPGSTISDIKKSLLSLNYPLDEVNSAFAKDYSATNANLKTLLASKPDNVSLEGYLYGDTYEFYKGESVENIIIRAMEELYSVVQQNNLVSAFDAQGLTLHEGLTLASIVQKEATPTDQAGVARVFYNRLHQGIMLGSDVTAQYAVDLVDPDRAEYADNISIVNIDSPYNTRKYAGLPPGPICNPSLSAMLATANPADSDYLYFLTGDDGVIYYSYTEDEHLQNVSDHCQELCNTQL